ncbi:MAG: YeeE/YedE family protein [Nitrospiraceae bacterium]|jgi:uncharacterized membrane protein YedE/YeeE|nr:YeeE/YedE family protein [Nitrospiraceae bacterium]
MVRAYFLAVAVQMLIINALADAGHIAIAVPPLYGYATAGAGFVYGLGMALSMGCAGSVLYRAGEGKLDYMLVSAAFVIGAWFANDWITIPVHAVLRSRELSVTIPEALSVSRWLPIALLLIALFLWMRRAGSRPYDHGWHWPVTGILVGITGVAAWLVSAKTGTYYGLGTMQGSDGLATFFLQGDIMALNWTVFMVAGIPLGSLIASRLHGKSPGRPLKSQRVPMALTGGFVMGICAAVAAGDNILHGLSGMPILALSSTLFMLCAYAGAWIGIRLNWLK